MAAQAIGLSALQKPKRQEVFHYAIVASIGSTMSGYCSAVMSGAVLFIREELKITEAQEELLIGSLILVSIIGSLAAGPLADTIGRKRTLLIAAIIITVGCSIMTIAPSYLILFLGRLLTGIGYGMPFSVVPLYVAEVSPPESRGKLLSIPELFLNCGMLLGYITSFCLSPLPAYINWRLMLGIGGVPAVLLMCGSLAIPESPRWLVLQHRIDEAYEILLRTSCDEQQAESRLSKIMLAADDLLITSPIDPESVDTGPEALSREAEAVPEINFRDYTDKTTTPLINGQKQYHKVEDAWSELLWPQPEVQRALLAVLGLQFFQQACGLGPILFYLPLILEKANIKSTVASLGATVSVGLCKTLFVSVATALLDRSGRRPLLLISSLGMSLSMAILGMSFYVEDWISASDWFANLPGFLALCCSCSFVAFFSVGMGPIAGQLLPSELFSLRLRAQGLGLAMATNRLWSGLVCLTFLSVMSTLTPQGTFFLYALMAALSIPFFYFIIPETKGKILEEIKT